MMNKTEKAEMERLEARKTALVDGNKHLHETIRALQAQHMEDVRVIKCLENTPEPIPKVDQIKAALRHLKSLAMDRESTLFTRTVLFYIKQIEEAL